MVSEKSNSILKKKLSSLKRRILKKFASKEEEDSYEFPLITSPDGVKYGRPIKDNKIPWKIRNEFSKVITETGLDDASQKVHDRVLRAVTANPILARVVPQNSNKWSLLMILLCVNGLDPDLIIPALKVIIESNPAALLWQIEDTDVLPRPIHILARFEAYSSLMPWIATHYSWILDHPVLKDFPPSFELVRNYRMGGCSAELVREFFEIYPQGLSHIDEKGRMPLHQMLCGRENDGTDYADLFRWMATQVPNALNHQDNTNWTPLHYACVKMYAASHSYASNAMLKITKYLIRNSPESIFVEDTHGCLPIHILVAKYQLSGYLEIPVVGALLRIYPDCYDMPGYPPDNFAPSSVPFLEDLKPILDESDELLDDLSIHGNIQDNLDEAMGDEPPSLPVDIFLSWTKFRIEELDGAVNNTYDEIEEVYIDYGGENYI